MARIELSPEDVTLLAEIVRNELGDLRAEIANTDSSLYREELHRREDALRRILELLERSSAA
jgi:hypothetical protein